MNSSRFYAGVTAEQWSVGSIRDGFQANTGKPLLLFPFVIEILLNWTLDPLLFMAMDE
jgi:hypothetical protein